MGLIINAAFLFIAFVTLAICSGFIANSARLTTDLPGYDGNDKLKSGHRWLTIASIVGWCTTVAILVLGILYIVFGSAETLGVFNNIVIYGLLFLALLATVAIGILAAIGASDINSSKVNINNSAYKDAIIGAVLGIVVFVLLFIALIIKFTYKPKKKEGEEKEGGLASWLPKSVEDDPELAEALL